jgi:DNA polymerase-3 subunit alpha
VVNIQERKVILGEVCKFTSPLLTTFSFGDGFGLPSEHVERAAELGMTALALTEHGNVSSQVQLEKACEKAGIKAIFGVEAYIAPPNEKKKFHQTILAQDEEGLQNLNRLVTESWKTLGTTSKTKWPTVHWDNLRRHARGLIVLSGCADSLLSCALLGGKSLGEPRLAYSKADYHRARRVIEKYQALFGSNYSIETQRFSGLERTCVLNPTFAQLAKDTGADLTATSDCHYIRPNLNKMQTILHAAHRGSTVEKTEASWEYSVRLSPPATDATILKNLIDTGLSKPEAHAAIQSTADIASRCTAVIPKSEPIRYPITEADFRPWR